MEIHWAANITFTPRSIVDIISGRRSLLRFVRALASAINVVQRNARAF
jgi:hypothetical protein